MADKTPAISAVLSKAWPSLRYLSVGVWLAWVFLMSSGMIWLSDTEFDGTYVAELMLGISIIGALICFIAPLLGQRIQALLAKRSFIVSISLIATAGALAIILAGPYYLAFPPLFQIGVVLTSLFTGVFVLKCGSLFGKLDSRRVFLYSLYGELVMVALSYFIFANDFFAPISGGPSLAGILAFALLPPIAAWLVSLPPSGSEIGQSQGVSVSITDEDLGKEAAGITDTEGTSVSKNREGSSEQTPEAEVKPRVARLPSGFAKLLFMIFFSTLVSEMFRNYFAFVRTPEITSIDSMLVLLLRLGFALVMLFYALRTHRKIRFSKMYQYSLVVLAVVVSLIPLLMDQTTILSSLIGGVSSCMNLLIWCLLSMVVYEKETSPFVVFGFGWGTLLAARASGWLLGMLVLPGLAGTSWESFVYWGVAILILTATILLFSENRLERLFGNVAKEQISVGIVEPEEVSEKEHRPWREACVRIGTQALLSQREQEVFELLSVGRSPKNIATHLVVSVNTVRTHTRNIYTKLDAHSREDLIQLIEQELQSLEE